MDKLQEKEYEYYIEHRKYLVSIIHKNEDLYQSSFLIYISIIYIFGIKTDLLSIFIIFIFSLFILDGIKCKYKTTKALKEWDEKFIS